MNTAPLDLVGVAEIANRTGLPAAMVTTWFNKPDFPEPVANLACGAVWVWGPVHAWLRHAGQATDADLRH